MKKLAFFDIDGTLIPENQYTLPQENIDALKTIMANGVEVFICTGRCYFQAKDVIDTIGTPNYICSNGQEVCYHGKILYQNTFDLGDVKQVTKLLESYDLNWGFETRESLCIPDVKNAKQTKKLLEAYNFENLQVNIDPLESKIYQFWINGCGDNIEQLLSILTRRQFTYYKWRNDLYEILPGVEHKAKGISIVKDYLDECCETYAFGDGVNDLEMIKSVDHGVSMGNAIDALKEESEYVTTKSSDHGIVNGLKMVGLL